MKLDNTMREKYLREIIRLGMRNTFEELEEARELILEAYRNGYLNFRDFFDFYMRATFSLLKLYFRSF